MVTTNGLIATSEPPAAESHPGLFPPTFGAVAPFLADLDTTDGLGKVYYREDSSPTVTQLAAECVQRGFPGVSFQPASAVVVTWESVAPYRGPSEDPAQEDKRNTFQAVLASSGSSSYAIFLYPEDGLQFTSTFSKRDQSQVPAMVAFSQGLVGLVLSSDGAYNIFANDRDSIGNLANLPKPGRELGARVSELITFFQGSEVETLTLRVRTRPRVRVSGLPTPHPGSPGVMRTSLPAWRSALAAGFGGTAPQMCRVVYSQLWRSELSPDRGVSDILLRGAVLLKCYPI
ncbi:Nidogen-1 [Myotis brandtii]|uniref:Nidogen-1 n=1 Tax=Myotis brandtii TaxID=109478 RepID=S7Q1I3_MYOBR|nr:Nidogen-1 [Myotis brandtii]